MNTAVIIVAAGSGSRFGGNLPKQFCLLAGRPVLMHTIDRMREALPVADIVLVVSHSMKDYWLQLCAAHDFVSPRIVVGGATRSDSVRNAVLSLHDGYDVIMVHDGARPLVPASCVRAVEAAMADKAVDGAIPAVPVTDSLRLMDADGSSRAVDRTEYRAVQTPQAFRAGKLCAAYASVSESFSDDASLMESLGHNNFMLTPGAPENIKITNPADLAIAETLLAR
ncbi:MAG: 2-C-methyl-D-erythritol 4-phosphate cytidylyltransferase [Muribaculaceae bacterium]|nr:2-C-methyl-D-erythritol 4-phosphate cytidylyltransferase [Muribaculaceae bacterium]